MKQLLICLDTGKDYEITVDQQTYEAFKEAVKGYDRVFGFTLNNSDKEVAILLNHVISIEVSNFRD